MGSHTLQVSLKTVDSHLEKQNMRFLDQDKNSTNEDGTGYQGKKVQFEEFFTLLVESFIGSVGQEYCCNNEVR